MKPPGLILAGLLLAAANHVLAAVDVNALWDFGRPELSEQRFRAALAGAQGDDALVLRTQIARTLGLRGRFDEAHAELDALRHALADAGPEPRVRAALERGRTLRSSGQPEPSRALFMQAWTLAEQAGLDELAVDALHMVALVAPTLEDKLLWNRRALDAARASPARGAQAWQGSLLNNIANDLRSAKRLSEALALFRESRAAYERFGRAGGERIARWQIANTLRLMGQGEEALAMQLALEREFEALGRPDGFVFDELAELYATRGDAARAEHYREKRRAMK